MKLLIKKLSENAVVPQRQTEFSAGYDLSACCDELILMTDDGSAGRHGNVTVPLKEKLEAGHDADR